MTEPRARIAWHGDFFGEGSLARVNRNLVRAAIARGTLDLVPCGETTPDVERMLGVALRRREAIADDGLPPIVLRHRWPPRFMNPARARYVHVQPWEFGHAPRAWIEPLRARADAVWCYSRYVRDVYVASGIDPSRAGVLPLGIDPAIYHPAVEPIPTDKPEACVFLYVGGMPSRKNVEALVNAYLHAFTVRDDVVLLLKDNPDVVAYRHGWPEKLRALAARTDIPPIRYIETAYTDADMARLYRTATALVHPYRGEGFGLPVLEAMACGTPVVVTRGGATDDFVDDVVGTTIPAKRVELAPDAVEFALTAPGWWLEPDRDALAATLRDVYARRDAARARGHAAAARAHGAWTWAHAAAALDERVDALLAVAPRPPAAYVDRLDSYAFKVTSRGGEDGMLYELFLRLRVTDPFFVELGAAPDFACPSALFADNGGWAGVFAAADPARAAALQSRFGGLPQVQIHAPPLALAEIPAEFDLLSLDAVTPEASWLSFAAHRPRVVAGPERIIALAGPLGYARLGREAHAHSVILLRNDLVPYVA